LAEALEKRKGVLKGLGEFDLWNVELFGSLDQNVSIKALVT
jgi:hypothetical protein